MHGEPDVGALQTALRILSIAKTAYPAILVVIFLVGFIVHGITTAPDDGDKVKIHPMRGPGGRPLPVRRKSANQVKESGAVKNLPSAAKTFFNITQAAISVTFLANAGVLLFETLLNRADEWWPGKNAVVSGKSLDSPSQNTDGDGIDICHSLNFRLASGFHLHTGRQAFTKHRPFHHLAGCHSARSGHHSSESADIHRTSL